MSYQQKFVGVNPGGVTKIKYDGRNYELKISDYANVGGYASVLITDCLTGNVYYSDGYLELNDHVFITKWDTYYEPTRENWICSQDLLITII